MVVSLATEARRRPSGLKATPLTLRRCPASGSGPPEIVRGRIQARLTASSGGRTGSAPVRDSAPLQRSATANPKIQRYVHEDAHGTAVESGRPEQGVQHVVLGTLIESWFGLWRILRLLGSARPVVSMIACTITRPWMRACLRISG